jgi:hypothetical protein
MDSKKDHLPCYRLAYEDFDFWVRSSKEYQYCYSAEVLVVKRLLKNSHSTRQYKFRSAIIESTYRVCEKAYTRCENRQEFQALKKRVSYEMKKAGQSLNLKTVRKFFKLWQRINSKLKELS